MVWLGFFFKTPALDIIQPTSDLKAGQITQLQSLPLTHTRQEKNVTRVDLVKEDAKSYLFTKYCLMKFLIICPRIEPMCYHLLPTTSQNWILIYLFM